ncbi:U6 small nuclear RNA (adenine-(43)-N(6))-methyltransferase [Colletotrichum trifolii]|uniref:U6 small nuclear RNA (Adenine-(43)-N(6))-methyltransferase n=1 Tax=Colletotrichum trifolii TaxID=5466 RepID=A0A4R8R0T4_COLTR|nr:U6 small nuclear RNA (adenine-(43)-N(6))-methyltransferase [Colletotrichum trifolii]
MIGQKQPRSSSPAAIPSPGTKADAYFRTVAATTSNWDEMGEADVRLGNMLKTKCSFQDPAFVMQLQKTILKVKFNLHMEIPNDKLCPLVINRHEYILWLKALMDSTSYDDPDKSTIVGLDIGTGASCIYPLLGCAQRHWSFVATDINAESLQYAKRNVELNKLQSRISVVARKPEDPLIDLAAFGVGAGGLDFVMTNPPFYESEEDIRTLASGKERPPSTVCTGADHEMITKGGEVGLVGRMFDESLQLRDQVRWFTAMFGKRSSMETFLAKFPEHKISNFAVTEFNSSHRTKRWAVAWSFATMRPSMEVARGLPVSSWGKKALPPVVEQRIITMGTAEAGLAHFGGLTGKIQELLSSLNLLSFHWDKEKLVGVGMAWRNVWSRAWRRQQQQQQKQQQDAQRDILEPPAATNVLGFEVAVKLGQEIIVLCKWREGDDEVIYESFCGFLKKELMKWNQ